MIRLRLGNHGSATAELAVAFPAVVVVLLLGLGAMTAGATTVRLQDATADAARLVARGEADGRALAAVAGSVGSATAHVERRGDLVCVTATAPAAVVVTVSASSCALAGGL